MHRFLASPVLAALTLLLASPVHAQNRLQEQALALQKTIEQAIAKAAPSVACVLVSRNEIYRKLGGAPAESENTGTLGDFDPSKLDSVTTDKSREERRKLDLADPGHVPEAFGSGVVIDANGLILTNYHVVRDATKIFVRLPGDKASYADIHAADPRSDLAILRVRDRRLLPLPALPLGDAGRVQRGHFVLTIANPFAAGFRDGEPSASWGIVSNLRRRSFGNWPENDNRGRPLHSYGTLIETDTRVPLGSSGGALLNLNGELIGLMAVLPAIHGLDVPGGFAQPLDAGMRRILEVLKRGEEVEYGFLGVSTDTRPKGVLITDVRFGSPAEREAHLRAGDVILAINGVPINSNDDLFLQLGTQLAGTKIKIQYQRGAVREVDVTLGKIHLTGKPIASSLGKRPYFRGLRVDDTTLLATQPQVPVRMVPQGVLVSQVQPGSPAALAELRSGDVITRVRVAGQWRPVSSPAAFYDAVNAARGPVELELHNFGANEPPPKVTLK